MYLHMGNDCVVRKDEVLAIFDMDNTTISAQSRGFLQNAQKNGQIVDITDDLPKSYIVTESNGAVRVFISSVSSQTLNKRWHDKGMFISEEII